VVGGEEVEQVRDDRGGDRGPRPDAESQCRGRVERGTAGQVEGLGEPGQPGGEHHHRPRIAGSPAVQAGGGRVGDEGEPVGDQRVEPGDAGRDAGGDGDLEQAVRGRDGGAERNGQAG
jgi:hypothetical protein